MAYTPKPQNPLPPFVRPVPMPVILQPLPIAQSSVIDTTIQYAKDNPLISIAVVGGLFYFLFKK